MQWSSPQLYSKTTDTELQQNISTNHVLVSYDILYMLASFCLKIRLAETGWKAHKHQQPGLLDSQVIKHFLQGPLLLTWISFNPSRDEQFYPLYTVGWNYSTIPKFQRCETVTWAGNHVPMKSWMYSISQEICTRFLLCCALLWLYIDWFSHIHQAYFTGTVAI